MIEVHQRAAEALGDFEEMVAVEHGNPLDFFSFHEDPLCIFDCPFEEHFLQFVRPLHGSRNLLFLNFHIHGELHITQLLQLNISRLFTLKQIL